jgi:hypothetical protein
MNEIHMDSFVDEWDTDFLRSGSSRNGAESRRVVTAIDISESPMGSEEQEPAIRWSNGVVEFKDSYSFDTRSCSLTGPVEMSTRFHDPLGMVLHEFGSPVVSVTMFGSRVRGEARPTSDYDMIIIMEQLDSNPNLGEKFTASAIASILIESGVRISPLVLTREEATDEVEKGSPLFASILSNYEILYDPTGFMAKLLDLTKRSCPNITYIERGRACNLSRTV